MTKMLKKLSKFLRFIPPVIVLICLSFGYGFYTSEDMNSKPIWLRTVAFDIYHFFDGANEERTSAAEKIVALTTNRTRRDVSKVEGAAQDDLYKVAVSEDSDLFLSLAPAHLDNLVFSHSIDGLGQKLIYFKNGHAYERQLDEDISDFDVVSDTLITLRTNHITSYDFCSSDIRWRNEGAFHHYFTASQTNGKVGVLGMVLGEATIAREEAAIDPRVFTDINHNMVFYNVKSGHLVQEFDFYDIAKANIERFDPLVLEWLLRYRKEIAPGVFLATQDMWHPNDVEFAPKDFGVPFIDEDDVIISAKGFNLVFIVSTKSLKIKYFNQGMFQGQHDPDFQKNGIITVFNNRSQDDQQVNAYSSVDYINLLDNSTGELVSGKEFKAVTRHSGGHSISDKVISSDITLTGRHFIYDKNDLSFIGTVTHRAGQSVIPVAPTKVIAIPNIDIENCKAWKKMAVTDL